MKRRKLLRYCEDIAKLYGASVKWMPGDNGGYWNLNSVIYVSKDADNSRVISIFCHELAHYLNYVEGKYPLYHKSFNNFLNNFKSLSQGVAYAHRAESYTEQRGKKICKQFFPKTKYQSWYKAGNKESLGFLYGYYFFNRKEIV